jgi:Type IV pili methyl-accepting chemotaxis transducer N-term
MLKNKTIVSRRLVVQTAAINLFLPYARSANAEVDLATAVNRVARLRALSQRSVKAYAQLVLAILPERSKTILDTAQKLMEAAFNDLSTGDYSEGIKQQLLASKQESTKLTALLAMPAKRELLASASDQADKLTAQANKTTELITGLAKSGTAEILNKSGKQRMLSQRIAKNYFLLAANVTSARTATTRSEMMADRAEFKVALTAMQNSPISTQAIRNEINLCSAQWFLFETSIDKPLERSFVLEDVAVASERLLDIANNLTNQYEKALKEIMGKS